MTIVRIGALVLDARLILGTTPTARSLELLREPRMRWLLFIQGKIHGDPRRWPCCFMALYMLSLRLTEATSRIKPSATLPKARK